MSVLLRPHHALCIRFFEGYGYDPDFVLHMNDVITMLQHDDPTVTLTGGCDCICEACPNNAGVICAKDYKVRAIDDRVMNVLGCHIGDELLWSKLYEQANEMIVKSGRLKDFCRKCQWLYICEKKV